MFLNRQSESEDGRGEGQEPRSEVLPRNKFSSSSQDSERKGPRVHKERVFVRIYDLGQSFLTRLHNKVSRGYGAFHSGVEVYGREWSFGMTFDDISTGVTWHRPGSNSDHSFRETLHMGYTELSPKQVSKILAELTLEWKGCTYNVLQRNCHNFSDCLCAKLGVARLPAWVNDLASAGAQTVEYIDSSDSGYDGGRGLADFFDSVKSRVNALAGEPEEYGSSGAGPFDHRSDELRQRASTEQERQQQQQQQQQQGQQARPQHDSPFSVLSLRR